MGLVLDLADRMTSLSLAASDHPPCAAPLCACQARVPGVACTSAPDADSAARSAAARLPGPGISAPSQAGRARVTSRSTCPKAPRRNRQQRLSKSVTACDQCHPTNWDTLDTLQETRWNGQVHNAYTSRTHAYPLTLCALAAIHLLTLETRWNGQAKRLRAARSNIRPTRHSRRLLAC